MRMTLPEQKKLVHTMIIPIRWGDMDTMGHVNNTIYFRYFETVRIDWMQSIRCSLAPTDECHVIVNAFCNFYKQLVFPGEVLAKMYVSDPGRSSFETWYTLSLTTDTDTIYAEGGATSVWVNFPQQKSAPMPEELLVHIR